jgi:hypothetical protein
VFALGIDMGLATGLLLNITLFRYGPNGHFKSTGEGQADFDEKSKTRGNNEF